MSNATHTPVTPSVLLSHEDLSQLARICSHLIVVDSAKERVDLLTRLTIWCQKHPAAKVDKRTKAIFNWVKKHPEKNYSYNSIAAIETLVDDYLLAFRKINRLQQKSQAATEEDKKHQAHIHIELEAIEQAQHTLGDIVKCSGSLRDTLLIAKGSTEKLRKQYWSNEIVVNATTSIESLLDLCIRCADENQISAQAAKDELQVHPIKS